MSVILDKLLQGQKVEWLKLKDVSKYIRGLTYNKSNESHDATGYKVLRANNINLENNQLNFSDVKTVSFDTKVKDNQKLYKDDILISAASGSREHVGKVAFVESNIDYYFGGFMGVIRCSENINPKYLFHIMTSDLFRNYLDEILNTSTINNLNSKVMENFSIPLPQLDIQNKIVKILDAFTALTTELTTELTMREKQYHYYRDNLLTFSDDEVKWKTLGETGTLIRGNGMQKKDFVDSGFPAIHYGQIYTHFGTFAHTTKSYVSEELAKKLKKAQKGDVLLAGTSENIQDVMKPLGWLGDTVAISGDMFAYRPNDDLDTKYLTYILQATEFQKYKEKYAQGAKVTRINSEKFLNFKIPLPSLKEQQRIANILDNFETYTNSITEGLPKEIALRQKQYEYYREQLLDFPK